MGLPTPKLLLPGTLSRTYTIFLQELFSLYYDIISHFSITRRKANNQTTQREGLCIKRKTHFPSPQKNHTSAAAVCREEKRNCYSFSFLTLSDCMCLPTLHVVLNQQQQSGSLKPSPNLSILLCCLGVP